MDKLKRFNKELLETKPRVVEAASAYIWFHHVATGSETSLEDLKSYFRKAGLSEFNSSRLRAELRSCNAVAKGSSIGSFRPRHQFTFEMEKRYPFVAEKSEDVVTDDIIIPDSLVASTRGYILLLSRQINASYNHNIFDGCAILMRRLLEILLIHSYEAAGRSADITDGDGFRNLSYIINFTLSNKPFTLAKEVSEMLDEFRVIGNFSAHKISYNCRRKDIDNIRLKYRLAIEELLYRSGIRK